MKRSTKSGIALSVFVILLIPVIGFLVFSSPEDFAQAAAPSPDVVGTEAVSAIGTGEPSSGLSRPTPVAPFDSSAPEDLATSAIPPTPPPTLPGATALGRGPQTATVVREASGGSTSLVIPVTGVRREQLVDTYTQARSSGRSHDAIDIIAARGTPVVAVATGTVLKLFQSVQGGITLYQLDPDRRTIYYYAHLDRYAANIVEGMQLQQGQTLGYVGDTGNSGTGNYHLHFEISTTLDPKQYWGGVASNPYPRLR